MPSPARPWQGSADDGFLVARGMVEEEDLDTPGRHIRLTKEGTDLLMQGRLQMMMLQAQQITAVPDRQLFLGARMYRCAHCGTRYESLPNLMGAVKCRQCGSPVVEET